MNRLDEIRTRLEDAMSQEHCTRPSFMRMLSNAPQDIAFLLAEVDELKKASRIFGCGYCGCEVGNFKGELPMKDSDMESLLVAFAEHDRTCPKNPLAKEVERLTADRERIDWLESKNLYKWANSFLEETWRSKIDAAMQDAKGEGK